jgi:hypothetical protein
LTEKDVLLKSVLAILSVVEPASCRSRASEVLETHV